MPGVKADLISQSRANSLRDAFEMNGLILSGPLVNNTPGLLSNPDAAQGVGQAEGKEGTAIRGDEKGACTSQRDWKKGWE